MSGSLDNNSRPFTTVTENDHSAYVIIASALGLSCVLVFTLARVVVRYVTAAGIGLDDLLFIISVALTIIQSSVLLFGCSKGLGATMKNMPLPTQVEVQKIYYASTLLWILAVGLTKISVVTLLRRINADGKRNIVFDAVIAVLASWTFVSFLLLALQCQLGHPWITLNAHCHNVALRWKVINALDIVTEVLMLALTLFLVWHIQTARSRKAKVVAGFACRLPIIIAIGFRLANFHETGLTTDPSLKESLFIVWSQTELYFSLISATIPSLLQFMRDLNTHFGGLTPGEAMTYGSHKSTGNSFPLSMLRSAEKSKSRTKHSNNLSTLDHHDPIISNSAGYEVTASAGNQATKPNGSIASSESQKHIIQKDVTYNIEYDDRA